MDGPPERAPVGVGVADVAAGREEGRWELEGDTLHINDSACFDAFATYRIGINENAMSVELLLDECEGRGAVLPGGWSRFIYGQ